MKVFRIAIVIILGVLLGLAVSRMAGAQEAFTDPLTSCDETPNAEGCYCDESISGFCWILPGIEDFPTGMPWFTTARLHIKEFRFTDPSPWGFRSGTYRSGLPNCTAPGEFPARGCAVNGFYHLEVQGGEARPFVRFWMHGPAYDDNGIALFGTFDDRFMVEVKAVTTSCVDYTCRVTPSDFLIVASGMTFSNGINVESAYYNFNSHGFLGNFWPQLNFEPPADGVYGWIRPSDQPIVFDYSTVFGADVGVRLVAESVTSESLKFNNTAYFEPWFALDPTYHVVRHNLPEPSQTAGLGISVLCLVGALAMARRKG